MFIVRQVFLFLNSLAKAEALQKQGPTTATMARDIYEKVRLVFSWYFGSAVYTFFLYSLTFPLISVVVRCHSWRGGGNSNWTWSNTAYSWRYYTGDTGEYSLFMEFLSELRSKKKNVILPCYLNEWLWDSQKCNTCNSGWNSQGPSQAVDTACSSSLTARKLACDSPWSLCCVVGQDSELLSQTPHSARCPIWYWSMNL